MKFIKDVALNLTSGYLVTVLSLIISIILSRSLGPQGKGIYVLLSLFSATAILLVNLGFGQAAIYLGGQSKYSVIALSRSLSAIGLIWGSLAAALLILGLPLYADYAFQNVSTDLVVWTVIFIPIGLMASYGTHLFVVLQDFRLYSASNLFRILLQLMLTIVFVLSGWGIAGVVYAMLASQLFTMISVWSVFGSKIGWFTPKLQSSILIDLMSYGSRTHIPVLLAFLTLKIDQFLVNFFLDITQVGIYSVAATLAQLTNTIAAALPLVVFARVARMDEGSSYELTNRVARVTITLSILIAIVVYFTAPWIVNMAFGKSFQGAIPPLMVLLPGTVLIGLSQVLYSDFAGRGKPEVGIWIRALSLGVEIIGCIIFLPRLGIVGAAISSTIAYALSTFIYLILYIYQLDQSLYNVLIIKNDDLLILFRTARTILSTSLQAKIRQPSHP